MPGLTALCTVQPGEQMPDAARELVRTKPAVLVMRADLGSAGGSRSVGIGWEPPETR